MNWMICGGNGLLGTALQRELSIAGINFSIGTRNETKKDKGVYHIDYSDPDALARIFDSLGVDQIINLAGEPNAGKCKGLFTYGYNDHARTSNVSTPSNIAKASKLLGIPITHASTVYVHSGYNEDGSVRNVPYTFLDKPRPQTAYGLSKLHGEHEVLDRGYRPRVVRLSPLFDLYNKKAGIVGQVIAPKENQMFNDGQISSPISCTDVSRWLIRMIRDEDESFRGVYDLGGPELMSRLGLAKTLAGHFNPLYKPMPESGSKIDPFRPPFIAVKTTCIPPGIKIRTIGDQIRAINIENSIREGSQFDSILLPRRARR